MDNSSAHLFQTDDERRAGALRETFSHQPDTLFAGGFRFSWWQHGGEPGPHWQSDKLELSCQGRKTSGQYIRARNAPVPPFLPSAREYTGAIPNELATTLLAALLNAKLFEQIVPSEKQSNLMDALKQNFELWTPTLHLQKTLYASEPSETGTFLQEAAAVAAYLQQHGAERVL